MIATLLSTYFDRDLFICLFMVVKRCQQLFSRIIQQGILSFCRVVTVADLISAILSIMANSESPKLINPIEKYFSTIGRYNYYFFILIFLSKVPIFWHVLNMLFLSPPMEFVCGSGANITSNECPCEDPVWNTSVFTKTVQTKYTVVCEQKWMISFAESIFFLGSLFGSMVFGFLSDL